MNKAAMNMAGVEMARDGHRRQPGSTMHGIDLDPERQLRASVRGRRGRRLTLAMLTAFVIVGLLGGFGYREATSTFNSGRYVVRLERPAVTRGGLPTHWALTIHSTDGLELGQRMTIETTREYFGLLDHNDLVPAPDRVWQTETVVGWEFELDGADETQVTLDVRTQPDARWLHDATTTVRIDGALTATFEYRTMVLP